MVIVEPLCDTEKVVATVPACAGRIPPTNTPDAMIVMISVIAIALRFPIGFMFNSFFS
jgi:hypothetical protein